MVDVVTVVDHVAVVDVVTVIDVVAVVDVVTVIDAVAVFDVVTVFDVVAVGVAAVTANIVTILVFVVLVCRGRKVHPRPAVRSGSSWELVSASSSFSSDRHHPRSWVVGFDIRLAGISRVLVVFCGVGVGDGFFSFCAKLPAVGPSQSEMWHLLDQWSLFPHCLHLVRHQQELFTSRKETST